MTSLFGRLKGSNAPNVPPTGTAVNKKTDPKNEPTPIEQLLADAGPLRNDGSDKFFGMFNPSNTCYCNSVVQCLYFSQPFREQVVTFPRRGARDTNTRTETNLRLNAPNGITNHTDSIHNDAAQTTAQTPKPQSDGFFGLSKKTQTSPTTPATPGAAQQENKDSFDYQKKIAYQAGPHIKMEHGNFETYDMPESLFSGLKDIFEAIVAHQARTGIVTPSKFLDTLRQNHEIFRSPMHQDAHEFLNLLLNEVVDQVEGYSKKNGTTADQLVAKPTMKGAKLDAAASTNSSWVHELFEGTLTSETRCLTCENVSQRDEVFLDLSVDLEEHTSVTSCLRKFSAEEMLCERNKFHCDKCSGLQEAEKRMKIKRLPRLLCLHLKRFKYIEEQGRLVKLFHRVVYPFHLRLFNTTDDAEDPDRLYELYAVIVHLGSTPFHGHYVSIIKTRDRGWLLFDDELVLPVDKEYVRNFFGGDPKNPACAYVLFYQATTLEAVEREQEAEDSAVDMAESFSNNIGLRLNTNIPLSPTMTSPQDVLPTPVDEPEFFTRLEHVVTAPSRTPPLPRQDQHHSSNFEPLLGNGSEDVVEDRILMRQDNSRPNLLTKTSSFSGRFRGPSMSLRQKPKFWGNKDKGDDADSGVGSSPGSSREQERTQNEQVADKTEKSKSNRFGWKRSSMMMPPSRE